MRRNGHFPGIALVFQNGSRVMVHGYGKVVQFEDLQVVFNHGKLPFCVMVDILMQSVYGNIFCRTSRGGEYIFRKTKKYAALFMRGVFENRFKNIRLVIVNRQFPQDGVQLGVDNIEIGDGVHDL